jgi:hypothetical protein
VQLFERGSYGIIWIVREPIQGSWKKLHNEELRDLFSLPIIIISSSSSSSKPERTRLLEDKIIVDLQEIG